MRSKKVPPKGGADRGRGGVSSGSSYLARDLPLGLCSPQAVPFSLFVITFILFFHHRHPIFNLLKWKPSYPCGQRRNPRPLHVLFVGEARGRPADCSCINSWRCQILRRQSLPRVSRPTKSSTNQSTHVLALALSSRNRDCLRGDEREGYGLRGRPFAELYRT